MCPVRRRAMRIEIGMEGLPRCARGGAGQVLGCSGRTEDGAEKRRTGAADIRQAAVRRSSGSGEAQGPAGRTGPEAGRPQGGSGGLGSASEAGVPPERPHHW